jgi:hypothetical protein
LFAANKSLAIWRDGQGKSVCGYSSWRDQRVRTSASREETISRVNLRSLLERSPFDRQDRSTAEVVLSILRTVGHPIRLNDLITAACGHQSGESETISIDALNEAENTALSSVQDTADMLETRHLLKLLFEEIQKLNAAQRKSLLLHMTDSHGYSIEWFLFTETATKEQLAALLEVSLDQFRELLWSIANDRQPDWETAGNRLGKGHEHSESGPRSFGKTSQRILRKSEKVENQMVEKDDLSRL